jgi:hypothetical protein
MKRALWASLALLGAGCTGGDGSKDTGLAGDLNLDVQIDGYDNRESPGQDSVDSIDVNSCVTADGRVYVVWSDDREGPSDVWLNSSADGGLTWLVAPIRVKQGRGNASGVNMTCSGSRVYVVWEDDRDGETGYENIYMNFSVDGGVNWEEDDIAIDNDPDGFAISLGPQVSLWNGRVYVVWYDQVEGAPDVYVATSTNGGKRFDEPVRVSGNREDDGAGEAWSGNPVMAVSSEGVAQVVWEDTRNGRQDIFSAVRGDGAVEFEAQKRIDIGDERGSAYSFAPRLGSDGEHAYVVWHDGRGRANRDIYMNYSSDGGSTWLGAAVRVETDTPGLNESLNPDLHVVGDVAHVVWQDNRDNGYDIYYRAITAGDVESGDSEERLDTTDSKGAGNSVEPRITVLDDVVAVLWRDLRADPEKGYNDLYYNFIDFSEEEPAWGDDLRVDSIGEGSSYTEDHTPHLYDGELLTTWADGRSGTLDVFFSRVLLGQSIDTLEAYYELTAEQE